ncbi:unnamed protein product, partial [Prorocentrum cordatum]
ELRFYLYRAFADQQFACTIFSEELDLAIVRVDTSDGISQWIRMGSGVRMGHRARPSWFIGVMHAKVDSYLRLLGDAQITATLDTDSLRLVGDVGTSTFADDAKTTLLADTFESSVFACRRASQLLDQALIFKPWADAEALPSVVQRRGKCEIVVSYRGDGTRRQLQRTYQSKGVYTGRVLPVARHLGGWRNLRCSFNDLRVRNMEAARKNYDRVKASLKFADASTELRIGRLRWYQTMSKSPLLYQQWLLAVFGCIEGEPTVDEASRLLPTANLWARQVVEDIRALTMFDDHAAVAEECSSFPLRVFHDPDLAALFQAIDLRILRAVTLTTM